MENQLKSPLFGPGGNGDAFYRAGKKGTVEAPMWLRDFGLDAYEFEAGQGLRTGEEQLRSIGEAARAAEIRVSYHTPYFISLSSVEPQNRINSIGYIQESVWAAHLLGAETIVVHTGSAGKITRAEAMALCENTLQMALEQIPLGNVRIGLETMGKKNQLGTLEEVVQLCKLDPHLVPVVDFGHMNARECGGVFTSADDFRYVFDRIGTELGDSVARFLHCHFSKIEWTSSGEKRHLTFEDQVYGPAFEPLMEALVKENVMPTIICESAGTQAEDALMMKKYYLSLLS